MSRLNDVLTALATQISSAINNAGITTPNQVGVGWPNYEDLTKIITSGEMQTTIYADNSSVRNTTRFFPQWMVKTAPSMPLSGAISGATLTFSGSAIAGLNIHALVGDPLQDALYQVTSAIPLSGVASGLAAAVNAATIPGVSATPSGSTVSFTGTPQVICNIGGSGVLAEEVMRVSRVIQVIAWTPDPIIRENVEDAILSSVGTVLNPRIFLSDGTSAWCRYHNHFWKDDDEQDFSMYESRMFFSIEYGQLATQTATQIEAARTTWETFANTTIVQTLDG